MNLPIRVRLTAWYTVLLAVILTASGAFVAFGLSSDLRRNLDGDLHDNAVHVVRAFSSEGPGDFIDASRTALPANGVAEIVAPDGRVLHAVGLGTDEPAVPPGVLDDARRGETRIVSIDVRGEPYRAYVTSAQRVGQRRILIVAESLRDVEESAERILLLLAIAGPAALIATAAGGWVLARRALLPVKRMTSQAEEIGIDRLQDRVAVPPSNDEVGHLAVTLNAMLDRLEQGVREKHGLIADASHELRTPLAVMRAELDVSLRADELPPAARRVLESVREEVDAMSRTVDNLLTLAQVDEGRLELLTGPVDLHDAIETAARPLRPLAAAKNLRLDLDGEHCAVSADPHRLQQALTNMIENAIKFTQPGGEVTVRAWCGHGEVGVTVADNGPGMPAAARSRVFDRFYRVDHARGRGVGGSGLGLAICREVAIAHGGRVWVQSEEGNGSEFTLAFPQPLTEDSAGLSAPA